METERLIIDRIKADDKEDYFNNISHDKKVLETFICRYVESPDDPTFAASFESYQDKDSILAIRLKEAGRLIGILTRFEETEDSCEIGYGLGSNYWGKGYATEAVKHYIEHLFNEQGFKTVYASFFTGNDASKRVMEKCGMRYDHFSEKELTYLGTERDLTYYYISKRRPAEHRAEQDTKEQHMEPVISTYLDLKGLNNTRDLGGMIAKDGRKIKPGRLIRSSRLSKLQDMDWFAKNVALVVDFRSSKEVGEEPDPPIPGVEYLHLPIFEVQGEGVSRDKESKKRIMDAAGPEESKERMASVYLRFVSNEFCLSQYRRFMQLLLEPREKAVLWHCTAGKDRTGTGALFIQELLGVGREDIMADYLKTNEYLEGEGLEIMERRSRELGRPLSEEEAQTMRYFLFAYEEYPLRLYAKAEELYGSFDNFIREGLGISDEEREMFRKMYLE